MTATGFAFITIFYFLVFWGIPLSQTEGKSKLHRAMVIIVMHGIVFFIASLLP